MTAFNGGPAAAQKRYYEKNRAVRNARGSAWRKANPDKYRGWVEKNRQLINAASIKHRHGKLEKLAGRPRPDICELCGNPSQKICWDHNHETGKFRGWLCSPCNYILGRVKDDPELLRKMAEYLEKHR